MEKIKVNEYIRLENGIILKYGEKQSVKIENNTYTDYSGEYEWSSTVLKHSPNIIDLIEEGDYVNGKKVSNVDKIDNINFIEWIDWNIYSTKIINDKFIKSIVTKEIFASAEYRVEV